VFDDDVTMPMLFLDEDDVTILLLELFLDDDDDVTVPLLLRKLQLGENVATLEELLELKLLKGDGAILTTTPPKLFLDDGAIILVGVVAMFRDPPPPPPPPRPIESMVPNGALTFNVSADVFRAAARDRLRFAAEEADGVSGGAMFLKGVGCPPLY